MRACLALLGVVVAACGAWQRGGGGGDPACGARWELGELEQRDALTDTWDATAVEPGPIWAGDLDGDGRRDVVLRYRGSRTHEAVVLRGCGGDRYQVLLDEVRASQVGTSPGEGGWLDLVLVDGKHRAEYHHTASGYAGPPEQRMTDDLDWQ